MRNSKKLIIVLIAMLTIGVSSGFATVYEGVWSGTGTGVCVDTSDTSNFFTPFATWEQDVNALGGFSGTWQDPLTGKHGTFSGTWVVTRTPPIDTLPDGSIAVPSVREFSAVSEGTWTLNNGVAEIPYGTYTMNFSWTNDMPGGGSSSGSWGTDYSGWFGFGTIVGGIAWGI